MTSQLRFRAIFVAFFVNCAVSLPQPSGIQPRFHSLPAHSRHARTHDSAMRLKGGGLFKSDQIYWPTYTKDEVPPCVIFCLSHQAFKTLLVHDKRTVQMLLVVAMYQGSHQVTDLDCGSLARCMAVINNSGIHTHTGAEVKGDTIPWTKCVEEAFT
jgi:hypothetical protein